MAIACCHGFAKRSKWELVLSLQQISTRETTDRDTCDASFSREGVASGGRAAGNRVQLPAGAETSEVLHAMGFAMQSDTVWYPFQVLACTVRRRDPVFCSLKIWNGPRCSESGAIV